MAWAKTGNIQGPQGTAGSGGSGGGGGPGVWFRQYGTSTGYDAARERYYVAGMLQTAAALPVGATNQPANNMRCIPHHAGRAGTIDRMGFNVTTGVAANARIAIYGNATNGRPFPGARLWESANIDTTTAQWKWQTPNLVAPADLLWVVMLNSASIAMNVIPGTSMWPILGYPPVTDPAPNDAAWGWTISNAFANGFPATMPTDANIDVLTASTSAVQVRIRMSV